MNAVKVYGMNACGATRHTMRLLDEWGVGYDYFDLDVDRHAKAWVRWRNGDAATPTVLVGLSVLANPGEAELRGAVNDVVAGRLSRSKCA